MFPKHLKPRGHGHGHGHHNKMNKHGGKHEKFGHHFKHPGQHMGKYFFRGKHHCGLDFDRGCLSENDVPDKVTQNVEAGAEDARKFLPKEFYKRRHHWICEKCCCGKNSGSDQKAKHNEEGNTSEMPAENNGTGETSNALVTSTQNKEGQDKTEGCCYNGWHYFRHHGGRRHHEFRRSCPRCQKNDGETTENEVTTDGEKGENDKDKEGYVRKQLRGHYKGKRGHGCRKCCQEGSGTENEDTTGDEGGIRHGHIRKHHRGKGHRMHRGPHGGHHGGRRGHKMGRGGPKYFHELFAAGNQLGPGIFEGRRHHGGKWGHGPYGKHHGGWKRHGCCVVMVDAAVNTGESETEANAIRDIGEDSTLGQNMEQDGNPEVGQEQSPPENDQVLEVANNLRKSSLE